MCVFSRNQTGFMTSRMAMFEMLKLNHLKPILMMTPTKVYPYMHYIVKFMTNKPIIDNSSAMTEPVLNEQEGHEGVFASLRGGGGEHF